MILKMTKIMEVRIMMNLMRIKKLENVAILSLDVLSAHYMGILAPCVFLWITSNSIINAKPLANLAFISITT